MPEIQNSKIQNPKSKIHLIWLFFAFVIASVYFFALGAIPLIGPDEPRYAQVAREMFERADWVTPTLGGANWFEKPALLYWLQIAAYKLFGVSEFAARFGSALFGLGTVLSLWILGRSLATEDIEKHRDFKDKNLLLPSSANSAAKNDFANWLALIAASSIGLLAFSRGASFDIILTFPMTASLVSFFVFDQTKRESAFNFSFSLFAFYFFIGAAMLAKGLIGIVFPFAIVAFYFLLARKLPSKTFIFSVLWGTILSLLIAASWYLPMYLAHGWTFVDEFFIQHHFQRFTSDKYQHRQPFWFFLVVLPLMTLPWLPFFLASIWTLAKRFFQRANDRETPTETSIVNHSSLITFAASWLLVPLVFFSFSGSKLPGYILPALPAALVLTATAVFKFVQTSERRKTILQALAFTVFAVVALLLQFVVPDFAERDSVKNLIDATNAKGYATQRIVNLYTVSHNAEFYAPERLVRGDDGKSKRYDDFSELIKNLESENGQEILVLVLHGALKEITGNDSVKSEVLADNGETAIVVVKLKN